MPYVGKGLATILVDEAGNYVAGTGGGAVTQSTAAAGTAPWPVYPGIPAAMVSGTFRGAADTGAHTVIAAQGVGKSIYVTQLTVVNAHATVGTIVQVNNLASGGSTYDVPAASGFGGAVLTFNPPLVITSNAVLSFTNVTTGALVSVSVNGYVI